MADIFVLIQILSAQIYSCMSSLNFYFLTMNLSVSFITSVLSVTMILIIKSIINLIKMITISHHLSEFLNPKIS